jgi:hypothetical protein
MSEMLRAATLSLLALLTAPSATADELSDLTGRLRDPRITYEERVQVETRLLSMGEAGAKALQRWLEDSFGSADERARKLEKRYLADFEKAARQKVEERLDKRAMEEIDELRRQLAKLRDDAELTKEKIHELGDPALHRLTDLLQIVPEAIHPASKELMFARAELGDLSRELEDLFARWKRCNEALEERHRSAALADPSKRWDDVLAAEQWLCVIATPMSKTDRETLERNRESEPELADPQEGLGILDLNRLRIRLGLPALAIDVKLCAAARDHSNDMRTLGFFAHESPVAGKRTPGDRAARMGTSASAENIAAGQPTGRGANVAWWYSPGHHKNMLGGHSRIGLGRSETYWTQMFG